MVGIRSATDAVKESANAVTALADNAREEISGLSAQLKTGAQIAPILIVGSAICSIVALIVALVAVSRHD